MDFLLVRRVLGVFQRDRNRCPSLSVLVSPSESDLGVGLWGLVFKPLGTGCLIGNGSCELKVRSKEGAGEYRYRILRRDVETLRRLYGSTGGVARHFLRNRKV